MEDSDEWDKAWLGALGTLPEMVGPGELPKLNEGLRYLFKELRQAQAAFTNESHLDGAYLSLVAVKAFLSLFRAASLEGLLVPLMELESALWALDEGITEPLLKPVRPATGGRPPASHLWQQFIGTVAYVVKRLGKIGYPPQKAYSAVASELNRIGTKTDRGERISARTVRFWCGKVSEDVGKRSLPAQCCAALMSDRRTAILDGLPPESAAEYLRSRLVDAARKVGVASPPRRPVKPSC